MFGLCVLFYGCFFVATIQNCRVLFQFHISAMLWNRRSKQISVWHGKAQNESDEQFLNFVQHMVKAEE